MIISFEGIDGSGKSTQAKRLLDRLGASSLDVLYVREPGGTAVSERIRTLLLDPSLVMDPFAALLLFSAARAQLGREKIRPFHEAGGIVICDRFFDSTVAYQGGGRQVADPDWLGDFQRVVTDGVVPDRTYLIRLDVATASQRLTERLGPGEAADRLESAGMAFFERVFNAYERLSASEPNRFVVINGQQSIDEVAAEVWADLLPTLPA